jgi:hypothetical protein
MEVSGAKGSFLDRRAAKKKMELAGVTTTSDHGPCEEHKELAPGRERIETVSTTASTISGRDIAVAPLEAETSKAEDYDEVIDKKSGGRGEVLEHFSSLLSNDIFGLPFSFSIAIPTIEDAPLIAVSQGFADLTGYTQDEIIGRNCRFLLEGVPKEEIQDQTRLDARRYCRAAHLRGLTKLSHTFLIQRNARKNGELFWNMFMMSLIPGDNTTNSWIVGLQLDLGADLNLTEGADIQAAVEPHMNNLRVVQKMMFGAKLGLEPDPLGDLGEPELQEVHNKVAKLGLAGDIKDWVQDAEAASDLYQSWGTLPWAIWPASSKYALLNGGTTLLRLEADEIPSGGVAMAIFPMKKSKTGCCFKIRIDELCQFERSVTNGGWLPSVGFTEKSPAAMDEMGGPPKVLEHTAKSVCLRGDGKAFVREDDSHYAVGDDIPMECGEAEIDFAYIISVGDVLECWWSNGKLEITTVGEESSETVYRLKSKAIPKPPKKPLFAIVDCSHSICKATLVC